MKQKTLSLIKKIKSTEIFNGITWTIIGSGTSRILILLGTLISSNILGVEKFGEFSMTRSTINVILVIAGLNLGVVLTKDIAKYKDSDTLKCSRLITLNYFAILTITLILSLFLFISSSYISANFFNNLEFSIQFKLSSAIILFSIIFSLNESIYRGLGLYKKLGKLQIISSFAFLIFVPLGSFIYNVNGAILGYLIYSVLMVLITVYDLTVFSKKSNFIFFNFNNLRSELKEIKEVTLPIFFSSILEAPVFWLAQVILIKYSGMASNGVASALLQTRNLILIVPGYVSLVALPILSKNLKNKKEYNQNFKLALKINVLISVICILPLLVFPTFFLKIYGEGFDENYKYLDSFLAYISIPVVVISNVYQQSIVANNKGWNSLIISIIWNAVLLITTYIFCKNLGLGVTGYMLSLLLTIILQLILRWVYERKFI
ncbi:MAG: oligosaccharide flippase family protein [Flavobacteriales bacterium]|nr:oligosaccharide flippase family protein [Flavobacteriales bacterium]